MITYLVATTKEWNIEEYKKYSNEIFGQWHLIVNKDDLTLENIKKIDPKYIFFPHWSWIVPKEVTNHYSCVCFHMTDLPYGRGGSPLQNLIIRGHIETKITALKMTQALDAGDIYLKKSLALTGSAQEIFIRASVIVSKMIAEIIHNNPKPTPQNGKVTHFTRRTMSQSEIPKNSSLSQVYNQIRMLDAEDYPKAYVQCNNIKLIFKNAQMVDGKILASVQIEDSNE